MSRTLKIYIGIFIVVIGFLMYLEYTKPNPIIWTPTYSSKDKIPFGTYIAYNELTQLFPEKNKKRIEQSISSYLSSNNRTESDVFFIINQNSTLSETDTEYLLDFVEQGNDVFIVSTFIPTPILDSLHLKIESSYYLLKNDFSNVELSLVNPSFSNPRYKFEKVEQYAYFSKIDSMNSVILGQYHMGIETKTNFIKQKYGEGYFYIQLFPEAYSNYFMLKDKNYMYAVNSLNYINKNTILWEENKKTIHTPPDGILMYIFNNPPLHWAWVILLCSFVLYSLFFGKRTQRIIPIIKPLKNTTVEFTQTIGNLYYNNKEHKDIINKKIKYFLYYVKEHYYMNIEKINTEFSDLLHLKSGVPKEITDKIVSLIQKNLNSDISTEEDLKLVNRTIDLFYKNIN
ncbi:DUF4350 domain-containing protein [Apibacter adventoris]|uniref:DUF4350 domain-containing protein n=1 Tax=Apibacter adventoris TaxID=1679466 RepID=UPI0011B03E6A|nr:DUF4350 domain-containing protein [Apibacter adventoris]